MSAVARTLAASMLALALGACAEFSPDGGMSEVTRLVGAGIGGEATKITSEADAARVRERVEALLREPLTADIAARIALLNNRGLQAAYNDLGLTEIAGVESGLPPNPKLTLSRVAGNGEVELEFRLLGNILGLLTLPARREMARQRFAQAQHVAAEATFRTALEARRAWVAAVAAQQIVGYLEQSRMAADATADLMRKLGETGGATRIEQARASAAYAELGAQVAEARLRARAAREKLARVLGTWETTHALRLQNQLPALPRAVERVANVETEAVKGRVDLAIARQEVAILARSLKFTESARFVSLLELSGVVKSAGDADATKDSGGLELEIEIPIFDGGEVKQRRERELYMRAVNRLAERAVNARSEARAGYETYLATHEIALQYQNRVLPLRRIVAQETLRQCNGMLVDVFDLLIEARERNVSNIAAIEARRAFLLAEIDLRAALVGGGTGGASTESPTTPAAAKAGGGH